MRNIKLVLAYDGTPYRGFQVQRHGPTIQEVLEQALRELTGEKIRVTPAGRTDAGVHALGQVVNFRTKSSIPPERFAPALSRYLPKDIVIKLSREVPEDFHARYDAIGKVYTYTIYQGPHPSPFLRNYTYFAPRPLDWEGIARGAALLQGRHDFKSFQAAGSAVTNTVRTLSRVELARRGSCFTLTFIGDGFLYHQVRNMVGTLLEVGAGRLEPDDISRILEAGRRECAGPTAPPAGLVLSRVLYP